MKSSHPPPNADNTAKHLSTSSLLSPNAVPAMRVNPIPTPSPGVSRKKSFDSFAFLPTQSDQQHPHVGSLQPQHSRRAQQIPSPSPKSMAASLKSNLSMPSNQSQSSYTKSKNTTATATFDTKLTPLFDEHREFPKDSSYLEKLERITSAIRPEIEAYKSLKQVVDARDIPELRTNNIDGKSNIVNVGFEEGSEESEQEVSGSCSSSAEITSNESNESSIFSESADDSRSEAGSESESDSVAFTNSSSESSESEDSNSPSSCFAKRQQHINLNVKKTTVHSSATTAEIGTLSETYHMASMDIVRSSAVSLSTLLQKNVSIEDISDADSQPHHHQRYHHHQHHHREHAHGKHNLLVREKKLKQGRLLLVSLLENFCMLYDQSPERNKRLFFVLCKQLSAMGIIDSEDFLDEISAVRGAYKRAFKELVMQAMQAIREENATRLISSHANDETGSQSSIGAESDEHENALILQRLSFVSSSESNPRRSQYYSFNNDQESDKDSQHGGSRDLSDILGLYPSRYKEDFEEMRPLGKGGFGQVWCVRNRLDGVQYAVKRVKLGQRGSGVEKILREVKVQARMTHQNVVRYFSCWLEHATPGSRVASTSGDTFGDDTMESTDSVSQIFDSQQYIPCVVDAPSVGSRRFVISEMNDDDLQINIAGIEEDECIRDNGDEGEEEIEWDQDDDIDEVEFKAPDILGTEASKLSKSYTSIETASLHTAGTSPDYNPRGQKNHRFKKQHFSPIAKDDKIRDRSKNVPRELTLFIQMELCGHTLQQYLNYRNKAIFSEKFGSLCESELIDAINPSFCSSILKDMCSGLSYIHSQACIHRDIKPQNIYFVPILSNSSSSLSPCDLKAAGPFDSTNSLASSFKSAESRSVFLDDILCSPFKSGGTWKIGDFGLVTVSDSENEVLRADSPPNATKSTQSSIIESVGANSLTKSSQISMPTSGNRTSGVGTVTYASPEQLEPSTTAFYTSKSDMYSVGIVFFELLHPIGTGMERARTLSNLRLEDFPDEFLKRWPKEATHILSLLSKDPECRPSAQSTLEFLHLLKAPQGQEVQFPGRRLEKVAEKGSTLLGRYQSRRGSHKSILLETIEATIKNWIDHPHKDHPTEIASKKILDELNDPERAFKLLAAAQKRADKAEEEMKAAKEERDNLLRRINEIEKINIRKKFK